MLHESLTHQGAAHRSVAQIDLVSADVVRAWTEYFHDKFPQLHVATFSCYPAEVFEFNDLGDEAKLQARTAAHRRRYHRAVGVRDVLNACRQVPLTKYDVQVDWAALIERYSKEALAAPNMAESDTADSDNDSATDAKAAEANEDQYDKSAPFQQAHPHPDLITIGLIGALHFLNSCIEPTMKTLMRRTAWSFEHIPGHPNVGKSSLINGLLGKKVVSASRTPGHTKVRGDSADPSATCAVPNAPLNRVVSEYGTSSTFKRST